MSGERARSAPLRVAIIQSRRGLTAPGIFAQETAEVQAEGIPTYNRAEKMAEALVALDRYRLLAERRAAP